MQKSFYFTSIIEHRQSSPLNSISAICNNRFSGVERISKNGNYQLSGLKWDFPNGKKQKSGLKRFSEKGNYQLSGLKWFSENGKK